MVTSSTALAKKANVSLKLAKARCIRPVSTDTGAPWSSRGDRLCATPLSRVDSMAAAINCASPSNTLQNSICNSIEPVKTSMARSVSNLPDN